MKITRYSLAVTMLAVACLAGSAFAQAANQAGRIYNPNTEITVTGTVEKVAEITGTQGWTGIHLSLRNGAHTYDVRVGPSAYVTKNEFTFAKGDQLEVTGSKVLLGGADALVAREIKRGDKTLKLRDSMGIPYWSKGHRWAK